VSANQLFFIHTRKCDQNPTCPLNSNLINQEMSTADSVMYYLNHLRTKSSHTNFGKSNEKGFLNELINGIINDQRSFVEYNESTYDRLKQLLSEPSNTTKLTADMVEQLIYDNLNSETKIKEIFEAIASALYGYSDKILDLTNYSSQLFNYDRNDNLLKKMATTCSDMNYSVLDTIEDWT
jgi:predicted transcriptional regulator